MIGWRYATHSATFAILPQNNGRWQVWCDDNPLGSWHSPEAALEDLVGNRCGSNQKGLNTSKLGMPRELGGWERVQARK